MAEKFSFKRAQEIINKYGPNSPEYFAYQARTHPNQAGAGTPVSPAKGSGAPAPTLFSPGTPAVDPHNTGAEIGDTLEKFNQIDTGLIGPDQELENARVEQPFLLAKIQDAFVRQVKSASESLSGRGLSFGGIANSVLSDIDTHKTLAVAEQNRTFENLKAYNKALHEGAQTTKDAITAADKARAVDHAVPGTPATYKDKGGNVYSPNIVPPGGGAPTPGGAAGAGAAPAAPSAPGGVVGGLPSGPSPGPGYKWDGQRWNFVGPRPRGDGWHYSQKDRRWVKGGYG